MARKQGANADRLLSLIERVERLEEERKSLADDIKEIFQEAKSAGFDVKVMKEMIKRRKLTQSEREEWAAMCELYSAALGMLDGTPLGDAARRRFAARKPDAAPDTRVPPDAPDADPQPDAGEPAAATPSAEELLKAKADGAAAAKAGRKVTENPHPAGNRLRAAWDEGWCAAAASDGMDIPDAWRRKKPAKGDDKGAGA